MLFGLLLSLFAPVGCGPGKDVVATYRGGTITKEDLERRVMALPPTQRGPRKEQTLDDWERELTEQLVLERVLVAPERLEPVEGTVLNPGPWRRLLAREYMEREGQKRVEVPDDSVTAFYERNWERFYVPEGAKFKHVFLSLDSNASSERRRVVKGKADSLLALAEKGQDFDELIQIHSESESKGWEGEIGMVFLGQLAPQIEETVFSLDVGEVGGPVETELGYHLIKVTKRTPAELRPLEEVAPTIRNELMMAKLDGMRENIMRALDEELPIGVNADAYFDGPDGGAVLEVAGEHVSKGQLADLLKDLPRKPGRPEELEMMLLAMGRETQFYRRAVASSLDQDPVIREKYRDQIASAYVESVLNEEWLGTELSEENLRSYFEENRKRFSEPKTWLVADISIAWTGERRYETWRLANEIYSRAQKGENLEELAAAHSASPFGVVETKFGDLTIKDAAMRGPEFQKTLLSLHPGETSELVRTDEGYLIMKLLAWTDPEERDFEEAEESVRVHYLRKNRAGIIEAIRGRLLDQADFRNVGVSR